MSSCISFFPSKCTVFRFFMVVCDLIVWSWPPLEISSHCIRHTRSSVSHSLVGEYLVIKAVFWLKMYVEDDVFKFFC